MNKLYKPSKLIINNIIKRNNPLRITLNINNNKIYNINNSSTNFNTNNNFNNNNKINRFFTTTATAAATNNSTTATVAATTATTTATTSNNNNTATEIATNIQNQDDNSKYNITISDNCVRELNKIQGQMKDSYLRVMVDMGGCSGYQYIIKMENSMQEDDVLFTRDGARVIIDKISLEMMVGSVIDYESNLMRSTFCVASNPNTIKSCGCKISFDLKK